MNPYESPQTQATPSPNRPHRLDRGVIAVALVMTGGCLASIIGMFSPTVREFLMPRFGWIGLFLSMNSLIFICIWMKKPTRSGLLPASFMTCGIGVINGFNLIQSGTVETVQNAFHDRLHSAWLWSVVSYMCAAAYLAVAAFRSSQPNAEK